MTAASISHNIYRKAIREYGVPVLSGLLIVFGAAVPVLTVACLLMNILYVLFMDSKAVFRLLFFLIPFAQIYKVSAWGGTSFFTYLELLVCVMYVFKMRNIRRNFLIVMLLWVVYVFLGSGMNVLMWIKQLMIPLLIYIFFTNEKLTFKELVISLTIGLLLSSVLALFKDSIPNLANMIRTTRIWEAEGLVYRFSGTYSDPNYYTAILILCIVSLLILFAARRMGMVALLMSGALIFFGAQTASKSFILMLAAVAVMLVMCMFLNKRNVGGLVSLAVAALAVVVIFSGEIEIFSNALLRLKSSAENLTTGRVDTWGRYFAYLGENALRLLFGSGINAGFLNGIAAHNTYIDLLYFYGVIGAAIFLLACGLATGGEGRRPKLVNFFPLICLMTLNMFLSSVDFHDFAFNLIFVLYALQTDFSCLPKQERAVKQTKGVRLQF